MRSSATSFTYRPHCIFSRGSDSVSARTSRLLDPHGDSAGTTLSAVRSIDSNGSHRTQISEIMWEELSGLKRAQLHGQCVPELTNIGVEVPNTSSAH